MRLSEKQINTLRSLEMMINLTHYSAFIGKRTKYGDSPHPNNAWGYTAIYLKKNPTPFTLAEIVQHCEALGCDSEIAFAEFIVLNEKHIEQDV
jgi:hypothetical protein